MPHSAPPRIRELTTTDTPEWRRMRDALFPGLDESIHRMEMTNLTDAAQRNAVFVCDRGDGKLGGFVEVTTRRRSDVSFSPEIGYIEAWYVDEDLRGSGVGRALIAAGEAWTKEQGLDVLGSDTDVHESGAVVAHRAVGFEETYRLVHFIKKL